MLLFYYQRIHTFHSHIPFLHFDCDSVIARVMYRILLHKNSQWDRRALTIFLLPYFFFHIVLTLLSSVVSLFCSQFRPNTSQIILFYSKLNIFALIIPFASCGYFPKRVFISNWSKSDWWKNEKNGNALFDIWELTRTTVMYILWFGSPCCFDGLSHTIRT